MESPQRIGKKIDKRQKLFKSQSFLGVLNEIKEVEEEEKPKIQPTVMYSGLEALGSLIKEQSKESTDPHQSNLVYTSENLDEHA